MRGLPNYDREKGSFRAWVKKVIRTTALMYFRKRDSQRKHMNVLADEIPNSGMIENVEIDSLIENEWETYITNLAMDRVKKSFQGKAIEAFELGLSGSNAAEIASTTGLSVASVYTLRKRVKRSLLLEVRSLVKELEF